MREQTVKRKWEGERKFHDLFVLIATRRLFDSLGKLLWALVKVNDLY